MQNDINTLRQIFIEYLQSKSFDEEPRGLYEPINYMMTLGGKRIRPVSMMIASKIYTDDLDVVLPVAFAFELFHNFTLAHDDVMDDANLRRGKDSMHVKYGLNSAILSGDAMMIYSYKIIMDALKDVDIRQKVLTMFSDIAIDICAGQQMDMDFEEQKVVELSSYLLMIKFKTAVLLAACMKAGALVGGASDEDADHLYSFGLNLGLAFQIQDDILDLYADDESKFGKKVGGDIIQKKKTFLYLKALEIADKDTKARLLELYNADFDEEGEKIEKVRSIFDQLNIRAYATDMMHELTGNVEDHLKALTIDKERTLPLRELSRMLLNRIN